MPPTLEQVNAHLAARGLAPMAPEVYRLYVPDEPPLPPLLSQAGRYAVAQARHLAAGMPEVDAATLEARLAVCRGCDRYRPSDERCAACGCVLRSKAVRSIEVCPLGRWPG